MKKKMIAIMIMLLMVLSILPNNSFFEKAGKLMTASAATYDNEPTYGDYKYTVLEDGTVGIRGYEGSAKEIVIPSTINGKSVTAIMMEAFAYQSSITSVTIPDSIEVIGYSAFENNSVLTSINIPDSVTIIGEFAFDGCTQLDTINIPDNVTYIGHAAFENTAWYNNQADGVVYKDGWCLGLKGSLEATVTIKDGIKAIAGGAFYYRSDLSLIVIPEGVKTIGDSAFEGCTSLQSIYIPEGVEYIGNNAFGGCSGIIGITIPDSVTEVGSGVLDRTAWSDLQEDGVLYKDGWCLGYKGTIAKGTSVVIPEGIKAIADAAFWFCEGLTSITLPESITNIGYSAFKGCSGLTSVAIPEGVTKIKSNTFEYCSGLKSISIPNGVESIGDLAFDKCGKLMEVNIPDSVIKIGNHAFGYNQKDDEDIKKIVDFKINCTSGSAAEDYAVKNGFWYSNMPTYKPTGIKLSDDKVILGVKETYTIVAVISPKNANMDRAITFTSSNPKIAKVDAKTGKITALISGTATITAKTANGKKADITVTVKKAPTKITVLKNTVTLNTGKTYQISYSLPNGTASNQTTYTSSKKSIASVDSSGVITAKQKGTTTITVKTYNGKTAKIEVQVK